MAENIFSDVTNEELDTDTLFAALIDEEETTDWKKWARDNFVEFIADIAWSTTPVFWETFESFHGYLLKEFFESVEPIQVAELRQAQIDENWEAWKGWMQGVVFNLSKENQLRYDIVEDMFMPEWHNNEFTGGCYGPVDFWDDISTLELSDLQLIRDAQLADIDKADYDKLCDKIFGVATW